MTEGKTSRDAPRSLGAEALKAFAHPLRMRLYSELGRLRAATASQLARTLGESSGQTSYHLRQLERHGFVEDDPEHPGGRERWWRPIAFSLSDPELLRDPASGGAATAVLTQVIAERTATLSAWLAAVGDSPDLWSAQIGSSTADLSDAEAEALMVELMQVVQRYADDARGRGDRSGTRRYRVHADVIPLISDPEL